MLINRIFYTIVKSASLHSFMAVNFNNCLAILQSLKLFFTCFLCVHSPVAMTLFQSSTTAVVLLCNHLRARLFHCYHYPITKSSYFNSNLCCCAFNSLTLDWLNASPPPTVSKWGLYTCHVFVNTLSVRNNISGGADRGRIGVVNCLA